MEKLQVYRNSSVEWKPSPVVALATSADGTQVAAAREDGALEIWLVSPGSVGWHCQLTIQGDPSSRVSSLVWCRPSTKGVGPGRLLSSSIDGSISEWDLFSLKQKIVLDSVGVSIWQMALEPSRNTICAGKFGSGVTANGFANHEAHSDSESSKIDEDEDDNDSDELNAVHSGGNCQRLAVACDDGCVRVYGVPDTGALIYIRAFPRVSGRILSVAWSNNAKLVFSGSSDGFIRCWDATSFHEVYRITAGLGGMGSGSELCIWSLLFLRCGTLVSGDSTGSVQFWDSHHGTLLQAHSYHKGDVNALATVPGHNRIFSAGSDGQVILYKLSNDAHGSGEEKLPQEQITKWVYVGYVRAHTHDVRALSMAVPISREDSLPDVKMTKKRRRDKPIDFSYRKWAKLGVPMLISAGDDTKLFAYSAKEFTLFSPHDICPAPQRPLIKLVPDSVSDGASVMLLQSSCWLDVCLCKPDDNVAASMSCGKSTSTQHLARLKSKGSRKIICSSISSNGMLFAYSDHMKPCLFELRRPKGGKRWSLEKIQLPKGLPYAHSMVFTVDSSCLMLAGHDRKIYVVDVKRSEIINTLIPQRKVDDITSLNEPPITRMYTSMDGQWLAAVSCFGDIYIFNLELQRQHWFIYRMNDASITAGGFSPRNSSVLVITTSSNEVYVFDVEAKQLGEWSRRHSHHLPRRFQEFPGEVIGLSFPPSCLTSVIVYSSRAMCFVDFGMPVDQDDQELPNNSDPSLEKYESSKNARAKKKKRKNLDEESRRNKRKNFDLCAFKDPVLFVGHLSESSILIMEKRWMEVAQSFDAPVHRHIFGT